MSPRLLLLRIVADCFQTAKTEAEEKPRSKKGMHCLGAGAGSQASPSGFGSLSGDLSVVRALGVLVCEGRIQGPPRGYKEGPHCVPPLQPAPNNHVCEKDNYLCDRYLVLVREITERVTAGAYLCVEVVLCSDCPCGLIKSKSKHRVVTEPTAPSWQQSSEMLLEYWCIGIVPSKSPETMNSQGIYQAVRSRLHFSQVAAWWSRTKGTNPSYIATRIVQYASGDEHLRRFRETPVEHTFPLASVGDGNSVQVSVWALPRMEDVPRLQCPMHPQPQHSQHRQQAEDAADGCARASTPTKLLIPTSGSAASGSPPPAASAAGSLVMPALLDDRLQIDCDKPGKHHCRCADEEDEVEAAAAVAAVAAVVRPNGERKRRRSLPCRPPDVAAGSPGPGSPPAAEHPALPALKEAASGAPATVTSGSLDGAESSPGLEGLERTFRTQLSIEEQQECCGNHEKRYKRSESLTPSTKPEDHHQQQQQQQQQPSEDNNTHVPLLVPWVSYSANGIAASGGLPVNDSGKNTVNLVLNPFCVERGNGSNSSVHQQAAAGKRPVTTLHLDDWKKVKTGTTVRAPTSPRDLSQLMSKLSFSQDKESAAKIEQSGILDWFTRVPGRVLGGNSNNNAEVYNVKAQTLLPDPSTPPKCELKTRNGNLELSPREFDEVLAVLRARTPLGRRRAALRTAKRRERYDRLVNEAQQQQQQQQTQKPSKPSATVTSAEATSEASLYSNVSNKADVLLGAILRSTSKENNGKKPADVLNGKKAAGSELPTIENGEATNSTSASYCCPESSSSSSSSSGNVIPADCSESSLPSAFNKRLSRLRQLFKRDQERLLTTSETNGCSLYQHHPQQLTAPRNLRVKRRIDFCEDEDKSACPHVNAEDKEEADETHCDSSLGTSTNSAHANSVFHSTNYDKRSGGGCCVVEHEQLDGDEQLQQRHMECCERTTPSGKSRGKRELSPIWVNHNNNNVGDLAKSSKTADDSESSAEIEEDGSESSDKTLVPSAKDQERFRRSLENAASMVFHSRTGLPLTSSPAPLRRTGCSFDFDSSLNSVSSKRSALFELNTPPSPGAVSLEECDRETENACDIEEVTRRRSTSRNRPQSHALLGSFEESALNGRLEPVSTVHGFTAEIGASGSFCPKHQKLPVTVFFYTLGDNDKVSSPYLAHINLGKKGYQVPRSGTIQVTLSNPLGTVVKMFVVLYDLSDMPSRSHTFLRQRTLRDKTLRYLIHLRFMSGKSGRIYLHTDVRMIICRKADVDTASDFGSEPPKELRSYIHGPTNPKFSPRC